MKKQYAQVITPWTIMNLIKTSKDHKELVKNLVDEIIERTTTSVDEDVIHRAKEDLLQQMRDEFNPQPKQAFYHTKLERTHR